MSERWFYGGPPDDGEFTVFGLHYAGAGASSTYGGWPERLGAGVLCAVQPPGRENRITEEPVGSVQDYADALVGPLLEHTDRRYALIGHCGAYPYLAATARALVRAGAPTPHRLFVSAWGAPHAGPYGRMNRVPVTELDLLDEVRQASLVRTGFVMDDDLLEIAAETLAEDLALQRTAPPTDDRRLPGRTVVVSWRDDTVVPAAEIAASGWDEYPDVTRHELAGDHWAYLSCPDELRELIVAEMSAAS